MEPVLYADKSFLCLGRENLIRKAAIKLRISIAVIFVNAVTLGMADPCQVACSDVLCVVIEKAEHVIFGYFFLEMLVKMVAMGACGCNSYLSESWNRFDFFIIVAGLAEYAFLDQNINIQAIRSLRMLRPLRAFTRIPSLRLLVSLILDTLPMLGNVFILFVFLYFAFGIVAVNLWAGLLRHRCFLPQAITNSTPDFLPHFYSKTGYQEVYLCSKHFGVQTCQEIPAFEQKNSMCKAKFAANPEQLLTCDLWTGNYTDCRAGDENPHFGSLSFDNLGYAFIALFQVISLEGWSDIMYYVQDTFSFHVWIYFVLLIMFGYYFAVKLCLVVIAAQFSVTRERQRLEKERRQRSKTTDTVVVDEGFYAQICDLIEYGISVCLGALRPRRFTPGIADRLAKGAESKRNEKTSLSKIARSRQWIRANMDRPLAQTLAAGLILINAVIMACEHHDEPEELAHFAEISNVVFTVLFAIEILLRLYGWGLRDFVREAFNMLDLVVSFINIIELASSSRSGLTVLRLFRLLRLVKLFRFLPGLQKKLFLMLHTVDNATAYFCFFGFAMYVSALFGMSLFGCQLCKPKTDVDRISSNSSTVSMEEKEEEKCTGSHFNSLRHSLLTVLQVFARDNWTTVMHTSMFKVGTWAVVYFIVLVIVGDYIILNLLTGILVEGFSLKQAKTIEKDNEKRFKADSNNHSSQCHCPCLSVLLAKIRLCFDGCGSDASLFFIKRDNPVRKKLQKIVSSTVWESLSLIFIIASCILIVVEQPNVQRTKTERLLLSLASYCITAAFTVEALLKIIAYGFIFGKDTYMRQASNVLDFVLVCLALADVALYAMDTNFGNRTLVHVLRPIRLLRVLRPLRFISRAASLRAVLQTLAISVKAIGQIAIICCFFFAIFAVLGVQLFRGCYGKCQLSPSESSNGTMVGAVGNLSQQEVLRTVNSRSECLAFGMSWEIESYNFDNFLNALTCLFVLATFNGWVDIPSGAVSCVGPDLAPKPGHNFSVYGYFISFLFIGCFFALNMFVGVVVNNYQQVSEVIKAEPSEIHNKARKHIRRLSSKFLCKRFAALQMPDESPFWEAYPKWRRFLLEVTSHDVFEYVVIGVVAVNIFCMSLEHYQMNPKLEEWLDLFNNVFVALLTLEMILKVIAQGCCRYCMNGWNRLDIIVNVSSLTGVVFDNLNGATLPMDPSVIRIARIFRIFRILKLIKVAKGLHSLIKTVTNAVPQVVNLSALFLLLFFVYGSLGVQLFGRFDCQYGKCDGLSRHANFTSFGMAFLTLFRVFTGDAWNLLLKDILRMSQDASFCIVDDSTNVPCSLVEMVAPAYFISFLLLSQFILINIVVAVLMQQIYFLHRQTMERQGRGSWQMPTVCTLVKHANGNFFEEATCSPFRRASSLLKRVNFKRQLVSVTVHSNSVASKANCSVLPNNTATLDIDGEASESSLLLRRQAWMERRRRSSWRTQAIRRFHQMSSTFSIATPTLEETPMNMGCPDISCNLREFSFEQFVTDGFGMEGSSMVGPDISCNLKEFSSQQFVTDDSSLGAWTCPDIPRNSADFSGPV